MSTPKGTKKQHFVPQLLLRQFADARESLFAYDMASDRSFPTTVRDAGHQNQFLSVPSLDGADGPGAHFERLFQTFEGPAIAAIRDVRAALASGIVPAVTANSRQALARFIAVQFLRTPEARKRAIQTAELVQRSLILEIATRNGFDIEDPEISNLVERTSRIPIEAQAEFHGEALLQPGFIDQLAGKLMDHVWFLGPNGTGQPLYVADHPVALYPHATLGNRGLGPTSYGVEIVFPLASTLLLSLVDRAYIRKEAPALEPLDGNVYQPLELRNVTFARSVQVRAARQFVYCETDDFADARHTCESDPGLRDPERQRVEITTSSGVTFVARRRGCLMPRVAR